MKFHFQVIFLLIINVIYSIFLVTFLILKSVFEKLHDVVIKLQFLKCFSSPYRC